MKKILSVLMSLVLLLSVCAFAEPVEAEGAEIVLGDVILSEGTQPILDLSGLDLVFGVYAGETVGVQLALAAADQEALALNMALEGEQLLLNMTGVTGVYSLNIAELADSMGIDAEAVANLDEEDLAAVIKPEDQMALMALLMECVTVVQAGTTAAGTEEIDGVVYDVTTIEVAAGQIQPLIEKLVGILDHYPELLAETDIESFTQLYEIIAPALAVSGAIYDGEDNAVIDFTLEGGIYSGTEEALSGFANMYIAAGETEDDHVAMHIELSAGSGETSYTLAFKLDIADENDGSWMPVSGGAVDLMTALGDESQSQQLTLQAMTTLMSAMSQMAAANEIVAALLGSMMAG